MSIQQTTPFSLFLYENMDIIRRSFMSPDEVINIANEIWSNMPHELKFSYFKKTHDLFIERNKPCENECENECENDYEDN